jgi:drug/metabolite transporter (DMT)-like permease
MPAAIFSVLLFGFVHPGSKFILGTGIGLLHFCLLYSGFRLLSQLPVVIFKKYYLIPSKMHLLLLGGMGLVGAALQFTEFKGISEGLPVSLVTFLLYSYPIWTILFSSVINGENVSLESFFKVGLSIIGLIFILDGHAKIQVKDFKFEATLIYPIVASFLMALWVCLANLSKKKGCRSWSISFYYDLFAFLTLAGITLQNDTSAQFLHLENWMFQDFNTAIIFGYAVLLGVVPNILFYKASQNLTAMTASLLLLFEPVISSVISFWAWRETLNNSFILGACLLLASNISYKSLFNFNIIKTKKESYES